MAIRYNKKLVIIMIVLILLSCTSCGVKQSKDKQEAKKKITWEGDYPYANSTDIFCVEKNNLFSYDINGENKRKLKTTNFSQKRKELVPSELYNNDLNQIHSTFRDCLLYTSRCV